MRDMLRDANAAVSKARQAGRQRSLQAEVQAFRTDIGGGAGRASPSIAPCPACARPAIARPLKHRPGFNLLARFKTFKDDVLRFLVDFDVRSPTTWPNRTSG